MLTRKYLVNSLKYISKVEKKADSHAISGLNYDIYLFGSRIQRKGGDLLIMAPDLDEFPV